MLDRRSTNLLYRLLQAVEPLSLEECSMDLGVSKRTLYYDLSKIDDWLRTNRLPPVQRRPNAGIYLTEVTKSKVLQLMSEIPPSHYVYTDEERRAGIFIAVFFWSDLTLDRLVDWLGVSRVTITQDFKRLREELLQFGITLTYQKGCGYVLGGDERKIRLKAVQDLRFLRSIPVEHPLRKMVETPFAGKSDLTVHVETIKNNVLPWVEKELQFRFSDDDLDELALLIALSTFRLNQGHFVAELDSKHTARLKALPEDRAALHIVRYIENAHKRRVPESERFFWTAVLAGTERLSGNESPLHEPQFHSEDDRRVYLTAQKIVEQFQRLAAVHFEHVDAIVWRIYESLRALYYRHQFDLFPSSGVKMLHPHLNLKVDLLSVTRRIAPAARRLIGDEWREMYDVLIAINLALAISESERNRRSLIQYRALIVCPQGKLTAQLLKAEVIKHLPLLDVVATVSTRSLDQYLDSVDLVLTTVPITTSLNKPVILVEPFLSQNRLIRLGEKIEQVLANINQAERIVMDLLRLITKYAEVREENGLRLELSRFIRQRYRYPTAVFFERRNQEPLLNEILITERIRILDRVNNWQEAIQEAAKPLLDEGAITEHYIEAMIETVKKYGPYIVIAPGVALAHARPEDGVRRLSMSLLKLNEPVDFSRTECEERCAHLIFVVAAVDNASHLKALSQLTNLLAEDNNIEQLIAAKQKESIIDLIDRYAV
ncbi:PTS sugar transporter subunit IIA [Hydrogenibacillus sp. N12]|uniref:BglG family transcription antiterminator n=1 Tax=Hydrogenibacillus sp. N12 TaxID=2866627 RepID=UPI001C7D16CE|nr:PTS sugar transporter subunit IIA [Hydrogenibacillus sp. N12]QZA33684.1 PTS sugar transporter subunit IIA [Hydrogenibacillus sp. N12]